MAKRRGATGSKGGGWGVFVAAVGLLAVLASLGAYAWRQRARRAPLARALAAMPADAALLVALDASGLRSASTAHHGPAAWRETPQAQARAAQLRTACGFDPFDALEALAAGATAPTPGTLPRGVLYASVRAPREQLVRCLPHLVQHLGPPGATLAPVPAVHGAVVYALQPSSGAPSPTPALGPLAPPTLWIALAEHAVVAGDPTSVRAALAPRASSALEGRGAALLEYARGAHPNAAAFAVADLAALRSADPVGVARVSALASPVVPWVAHASAAQLASCALTALPSGVRFSVAARAPSAADAAALQSSLALWLNGARMLAQVGLGVAAAELAQGSSVLLAANPALGPQVQATGAAVSTAGQVLARLAPRAEGALVRLDVDLADAELRALTLGAAGAHALSEARARAPSSGLGAPFTF